MKLNVHVLLGSHLYRQYFNGRTYVADDTYKCYFTPLGLSKVSICKDCEKKNLQGQSLDQKRLKKNRKIMAISSLFIVIACSLILFYIITSPIGFGSFWGNFWGFILSSITILIALGIIISTLFGSDKGIKYLYKFSNEMEHSKGFLNTLSELVKKINTIDIVWDNVMFGSKLADRIAFSPDSANLLFILTKSEQIFEDINVWFSYHGRDWYRSSFNNIIGYNVYGRLSQFQSRSNLFAIDPIACKERRKYHNDTILL
jgi:hypothetical protein